MSGLYYLGIIEGTMHARGEDAYPVRVWHALKMLAEILNAPEILPTASQPLSTETKKKIIEIKDGLDELTASNFAEAIVEKKKRQWSPEARARAAERTQERQATGKMNHWRDEDKVKKFIEQNGVSIAPQAKVTM